jgi:hypothetical protein
MEFLEGGGGGGRVRGGGREKFQASFTKLGPIMLAKDK